MDDDNFAGWTSRTNEPFENKAGPFFHRIVEGGVVGAFRADETHVNGIGIVHGGCLLTLVDYTLFTAAKRVIGDGEAVTISLASEFVGSGKVGDLIEARTEIVKAGRSVVFARGLVTMEDNVLMSFSGAMKRIAGS